jgi:hypothetical protein
MAYKRKRELLFRVISVLLGLFASTLILEVVFRILPTHEGLLQLPVNRDNPINRFEKNRDFIFSQHWNFSIIARKHSNNYGFLNDQDYNNENRTPLLAIIGDSYVEAAHVNNRQAMHGILSKKIAGMGRVYSFGASGSQLSTYLAYAEYVRDEFKPDAMVFIIIGNDFDQSLWEYRQTPGFHYFSPSSGTDSPYELRRVDYNPSMIRQIAKNAAMVKYILLNLQWNRYIVKRKLSYPAMKERYMKDTAGKSIAATSKHLTDSMSAIDEFFGQLPVRSGARVSQLLFVLDGMRPALYSDSDLSTAAESYPSRMRTYFTEVASEKGYEVIDMQPVFIEHYKTNGLRFEFDKDGHWNQLAHRLVAEEIGSSSLVKKVFEYENIGK